MADMIDKAEALAERAMERATERYNGCKPHFSVRDADLMAMMATALRAAAPARGVGVKPLQWRDGYCPAASPELYQIWPDNGASGAPDDPLENFDGFMLYSPHMMALGIYPTIDAAKAAAQADYEARILAALAPTDAAQAQAEDAHAKGETAGQMLERLGMDGVKWAAEFRTTALRLGYSDMDEGWLIGWFCNSIMAGYDRAAAQAREAALREAADAWEAFKAATTSADHFAAVERLDAALIGDART